MFHQLLLWVYSGRGSGRGVASLTTAPTVDRVTHTFLILEIFSESQIYNYIARVFYNVVFSTYLRSNAA